MKKELKKNTRKTTAAKKTDSLASRAQKPRRGTVGKKAAKPENSKERKLHIREAAYYLAENDGFAADPASYWLKAEEQIEKQ